MYGWRWEHAVPCLARQLLIETLLLAGGGAVVGVALAVWMGRSLAFLFPSMDIPLDLGGGMSLRTLVFTLLAAVAATLLSGTVPALLTARSDLNESLKEGGRSGGAGSGSHRLRGLLVISEMALVMVALIGAGLFYRSFRNATGLSSRALTGPTSPCLSSTSRTRATRHASSGTSAGPCASGWSRSRECSE